MRSRSSPTANRASERDHAPFAPVVADAWATSVASSYRGVVAPELAGVAALELDDVVEPRTLAVDGDGDPHAGGVGADVAAHRAVELRQVDLRAAAAGDAVWVVRCTQPPSSLDHISWIRYSWPPISWS